MRLVLDGGMAHKTYTLNLSCNDRPGIVAAISSTLATNNANIAESAQYWDRAANIFFMRIVFEAPQAMDYAALMGKLAPIISQFGMQVNVTEASRLPRLVILVSKFDHCLHHLLYQLRTGWLKADVAAVISNHDDCRALVENAGVQYHHWPLDKNNKAEQEEKILSLFNKAEADVLVLARYMQVLSPEMCKKMHGRVINIHHSFLPGFKGAKPYHQAFERGVKIIGATAHFVTANLDEGPIIEQETERVTHAMTPDDLAAVGRDMESRVLARAVKLHIEGRVLLNGHKTVVL